MVDRTNRAAQSNNLSTRIGLSSWVVKSWVRRRGSWRKYTLGAFVGYLLGFSPVNAENARVRAGAALYHLAAEDASIALREFSRQSGVQLVFPMSAVRREKPVQSRGSTPPRTHCNCSWPARHLKRCLMPIRAPGGAARPSSSSIAKKNADPLTRFARAFRRARGNGCLRHSQPPRRWTSEPDDSSNRSGEAPI